MDKNKNKNKSSNKIQIPKVIISFFILITTLTVSLSIFAFSVCNFNINKKFYFIVLILIFTLSSFFAGLFINGNKKGIKVIVNILILFFLFVPVTFCINKNTDILKIIILFASSIISGIVAVLIKPNKRKGRLF